MDETLDRDIALSVKSFVGGEERLFVCGIIVGSNKSQADRSVPKGGGIWRNWEVWS